MPSPTKADLRTQFAAYRQGLSETDYARRSTAIIARAKTLNELNAATCVHVYWPLVQRHEVDTRPLIAWLYEAGKQIVLPVVDSFDKKVLSTPRLRHIRYDPSISLTTNRWGIHEPDGGTGVPVEDIDAVVVPTLGAGRNGHRIGHGFGYYDELLADVRGPAIGLVYAACLVDAVPAEVHDRPLSVILTEDEVIRPAVTS
ncbi:MAG TPA: 5-formyltetrahydrofolate cyclo-ligase [Rhodothermales bacterium]|nr:5-formyltetrahydrofolate cyclo-ligase [Rhodothermales bacterium]